MIFLNKFYILFWFFVDRILYIFIYLATAVTVIRIRVMINLTNPNPKPNIIFLNPLILKHYFFFSLLRIFSRNNPIKKQLKKINFLSKISIFFYIVLLAIFNQICNFIFLFSNFWFVFLFHSFGIVYYGRLRSFIIYIGNRPLNRRVLKMVFLRIRG